MNEKKSITLRIDGEQVQVIEDIKESADIKVTSKAIYHACKNFIPMEKSIIRLKMKNEDLESEIVSLKNQLEKIEKERDEAAERLSELEPKQLGLI